MLTARIEAYITEVLRKKSTILLGLMEERFRERFTEDETLDLGLEAHQHFTWQQTGEGRLKQKHKPIG